MWLPHNPRHALHAVWPSLSYTYLHTEQGENTWRIVGNGKQRGDALAALATTQEGMAALVEKGRSAFHHAEGQAKP